MIAATDDGILMDTNRSWSIDDKRLNFQFGCEIGWEIRDGKRGRMIKNPTYTGISPRFWGSLPLAVACGLVPAIVIHSAYNHLLLPPLDLSASGSASLGFFLALHQGPGSDSRFDVEASVDGGSSWTAAYTRTEDTVALEPFNLVEVDLSAFAGAADVRVRLRACTAEAFIEVDLEYEDGVDYKGDPRNQSIAIAELVLSNLQG